MDSLFQQPVRTYLKITAPLVQLHRACVVAERLPLVAMFKGATEPTNKDINGKSGVLLWRFDAQPQKMITIRHDYSVRYPKDRMLEATEDDAE